MKRRHFLKNGIALSLGATLSTQLTGCNSSDNFEQSNVGDGISVKTLKIVFEFKLLENPQSHYAGLTPDQQAFLDKNFPDFTPSSIPYNTESDTFFVVNHTGASKLLKDNTISQQSSSGSVSYSYETTTAKDNYAMHMFYKKTKYEALDEDDIIPGSPPQYSLAALALIVPDGTSNEETITFSDTSRETVKALIFSAPTFKHFSRDDMYYAVSKFDDIFTGRTRQGKTIPVETNLELVMNHLGNSRWYYYQVYRDPDGNPVLRTTKSVDSNGNTIHNIGDPVYTFPLRQNLGVYLQQDINHVIQYFSADKRLSSKLLPIQPVLNTAQQRAKVWTQALASKSASYEGIQYSIDTSSLKSEGMDIVINSVDGNNLHITASNAFNRHVGLYAIFLDNENNVIYSGQENEIFPDTKAFRNVGILTPRFALLAIPVSNYKKQFTIELTSKVHTVRFVLGALSFNNGHYANLYKDSTGAIDEAQKKRNMQRILTDAEAYTISFEMALPSLLILWGATINRNASFENLLLLLGAKFAINTAKPFLGHPDLKGEEALVSVLKGIATTLLLSGSKKLTTILLEAIDEAVLEDSLPVVGSVFRAMATEVGMANLSDAISAARISNAVNSVDVTRTHTLKIQLKSDPKDNDFPLNVDSIVIRLTFSSNTSVKGSPYTLAWDKNKSISHSVKDKGTYSTYDISLKDVPAGGYIHIAVQLKIGDWIAAHQEKEINNFEDSVQIVEIIENLIPIGGNSIYQHYAQLEKSAGNYVWNVKQKDALLPSPTVSDTDLKANELLKISVNDPIGAIGYAYKELSTGQYHIKNISAVLATADQGKKSFAGSNMMQLSYDLTTSDALAGHMVFEAKEGLTYVRNVDIDSQSNDFNIDFATNIGIFITDTITQFAYCPQKKILAGLDTNAGVLHILRHLDAPRDDSDTNRYINAHSMPKTHTVTGAGALDPKTQYLYDPLLLTMSPGGDIVILEYTSSGTVRLRAFNQFGAVYLDFPGFNNGTGVFHLKSETLSVSYLDINVESKGFIYVLKQLGSDPTNSENYFLDIYDPHSATPNEPLVTTKGFSTAKIKVDYWRRVYALNYETTEDNEPTLSVWIPPVP